MAKRAKPPSPTETARYRAEVRSLCGLGAAREAFADRCVSAELSVEQVRKLLRDPEVRRAAGIDPEPPGEKDRWLASLLAT